MVHAIEVSSFKPGDEVLVQGPGPIGLLTALALRAAGAGLIVVTGLGIDAERLALARQLGFLTIDIDQEKAVDVVRELTQGWGGDIVFDAAGAMSDAAHLLKRGGELTTWARAIHLLASRRVDVNPLVSHRVLLTRGQEAFDVLVHRQGIKIFIEPDKSS